MKVVDSGGGGLSNQTSSKSAICTEINFEPPTKIQHIVQVKQEKQTIISKDLSKNM